MERPGHMGRRDERRFRHVAFIHDHDLFGDSIVCLEHVGGGGVELPPPPPPPSPSPLGCCIALALWYRLALYTSSLHVRLFQP